MEHYKYPHGDAQAWAVRDEKGAAEFRIITRTAAGLSPFRNG